MPLVLRLGIPVRGGDGSHVVVSDRQVDQKGKATVPVFGSGGAPAPKAQASGGIPRAAVAAVAGSVDDPNAEQARKRKNNDAIPGPKPVTTKSQISEA